MRRVLRDNGLSITMFALFLVFLVLQSIAGYKTTNSENEQHRQPPESFGEYLTSGAFVEATFENWESEFLQMGAYVVLTALLIQKGSPESKKPEGDEVDADPRDQRDAEDAPGPVKRGGLVLTLYEHSLSIALFSLFLLSFVLHALGGHAEFNQQQLAHGAAQVSLWSFVTSSAVLVPVHAELAERVPGRGRPHRPRHLPPPARLPRVQARRRPPRPDRQQLPRTPQVADLGIRCERCRA